jgi:hypothetical protein
MLVISLVSSHSPGVSLIEAGSTALALSSPPLPEQADRPASVARRILRILFLPLYFVRRT